MDTFCESSAAVNTDHIDNIVNPIFYMCQQEDSVSQDSFLTIEKDTKQA